MNQGKNASVIIPARNEPVVGFKAKNSYGWEAAQRAQEKQLSWTWLTVEQIRKTLPEAEIIVIDDASENGCCFGLANAFNAKVFRNESPQGVAKSRNFGISKSTREIIMVCDSHVFPIEDNAYPNLLDFASRNWVFAVAGTHTFLRRKPVKGGRFLFLRDKYLGWQYGPSSENENRLQVPNGGCYAFQRKLYDFLGLWPTTDGVFGHNPIAKGLLCWFTDTPAVRVPEAPVVHRYGGVGYSFDTRSQWFNANRLYSIVFEESTYKEYWFPIFRKVLTSRWCLENWNQEKVAAEREIFHSKKKHTDSEFFEKALEVPHFKTNETGVSKVPKVAVVMPSRNEGKEPSRTVKSIRHWKFDADIVIVNDGGEPIHRVKPECLPKETETEDFLKFVAENPVHSSRDKTAGNKRGAYILRNPERLGIPKSRNIAFEFAKSLGAEIIVNSDVHVRFDPGALQRICQSAIETEGIVQPSFGNWERNPEKTGKPVFGADLILRKKRGLGAGYRRKEPKEKLSSIPHIIGSVYAARTCVWDKVLPFYELPGSVWGCQEALLTRKAFAYCVPLYCDKRAFIRHKLSQGKTVPSQGYITTVHFLHLLGFPRWIYDNYFYPVIEELGPFNPTPEQRAFIENALRELAETEKRGYLHFLKEKLPEIYEDIKGIICNGHIE